MPDPAQSISAPGHHPTPESSPEEIESTLASVEAWLQDPPKHAPGLRAGAVAAHERLTAIADAAGRLAADWLDPGIAAQRRSDWAERVQGARQSLLGIFAGLPAPGPKPDHAATLPLRPVLALFMAADPTPLTPDQDEALKKALDRAARELGYASWVEAYHDL